MSKCQSASLSPERPLQRGVIPLPPAAAAATTTGPRPGTRNPGLALPDSGDAEVRQAGLEVLVQENVFRLDVAVDHLYIYNIGVEYIDVV